MSVGAYLLVKFNDREKLLPAARTLGDLKQISKWNAVDGHYNLVLKLAEKPAGLIEKIRSLDGFAEMSSCELVTDNETDAVLSEEYSYSYLFMETEKDKHEAVCGALRSHEAVVFCSPSTGNFDLVALVKGADFSAINRAVQDGIRKLDGVLRMKQARVIYLDRM